jgi:long-chain fatty acid transport protein
LLAAIVGAVFAGQAQGAGFALIEQNASGLGNAYSGQAAAAEDASTIWFNPAGMTRLSGRQAVGALTAVKPSAKFSIGGSQPCTQALSAPPITGPGALPPLQSNGCTNSGGDAGDWGFPLSAYLSWQLTPGLWLGLGVSAPFGLTTEWDSGWVGRFHAIKSEVLTVNINPSVAWKINDMFSVGAGVNAMYIDAELTSAVNYSVVAVQQSGVGPGLTALAAPGACPGANTGAVTGTAAGGGANCEGQAKIKGDDWGWGWNLGAMINFSPNTRLGLTYRSTVKQKLGGDVSFSNRPAFLANNALVANSGVSADIKLPDSFSVAISHSMDRWQFLADYTWTGWDSIQDLSIYRTGAANCCLSSTPLNFKNSWRAGLGVNYQLNPEWKLRGGIAYDTTPVQDAFRTPRLPDQDRTWLSIGAQWMASKQLAIDFGYAYLFVKDASSNLPSTDPNPVANFPNPPKGNLIGTYNANVNILGIQARFSF